MEKKQKEQLLELKLPGHRQAYSDRTAWIMAFLSELAYLRYDPMFENEKLEKYVQQAIEKYIDENRAGSLRKLVEMFSVDTDEEKEQLEDDLQGLKLELVEGGALTNSSDTQAIIVKSEQFVAVAFRGTEANRFKDIKHDAQAGLVSCNASGGRVHEGFQKSYESIEDQIIEVLSDDALKSLPLFITGHSLGGALAIIATKRLQHDGGIAACYTFGGPRVGDEDWVKEIKSPVYRLVNAADAVTMLPPNGVVVSSLSFLAGFIPVIGQSMREFFMRNLQGYMHCGDMRYLTDCSSGTYKNVSLLFYVSFFYRMKALFTRAASVSAFVKDHSIVVYREKLGWLAIRRNLRQ